MFGFPMLVKLGESSVILRPPQKSEMDLIAKEFSSMVIHMYTMGMNSFTPEDEMEWWEKSRKDSESALWAIVPDNNSNPIGITGLHKIHPVWGCCTSGIIIFDRRFWGKGIAYIAHLARTWYAVNTLNRMTIQSSVRTENTASLKALQKVGYFITGMYHRNVFRKNKYIDTYLLSWINPYKIDMLYPNGIENNLEDPIKIAKQALELAEETVSYI